MPQQFSPEVWRASDVLRNAVVRYRGDAVNFVFDDNAWSDYVDWQTEDRQVLKRINQLLSDIARNGNEGTGKPDPLKHGFQGYRARRITHEHRLVYKIADNDIRIAACRYHY
jgi:toxin YoeB